MNNCGIPDRPPRIRGAAPDQTALINCGAAAERQERCVCREVRQQAVTGDHWPYDRRVRRRLSPSRLLASAPSTHSFQDVAAAPRRLCSTGYLCEVHHVEDWARGGLINIDIADLRLRAAPKLLDQGWTTRKLPTGDTQ